MTDCRSKVLECLVGSHNYNLNTKESDKDYKVFVLPTFDDLYVGNMYSKSIVGETADYDYHDIRKLENLLWKANINFIEILYSNEINYDEKQYPEIAELFSYRKRLVKMNLPYLYNACKGMCFTKMKQLDKGTEGTKHLVEKFGYDTKQAMNSYRVIDFLERFKNNEFSDFKGAIYYNDTEREFLLSIKNGVYTKSEFMDLINKKLTVMDDLAEVYGSFQPDEEMKEILVNLLKKLVKRNLLEER